MVKAKDKFKIGQEVCVKGLKKTCGRITFVRKEDGITKYRIVDKNDIHKFWNESSLKLKRKK